MAKQNSSSNLSLLLILFLSILLVSCNKKSSNEEYKYDKASSTSTPTDTSTPTTTNTSTLNITTNSGSVTSNPSGIDCGSDCSESYAKGTSVQLTATSKNSYKFSSWGGDCSGSDNPLTVAMDKDKTCFTSFTRDKKLTDTGQTMRHCGTSDFPSFPCGEDSEYIINPPSFTVTDGGDTVTDNNTGLIWQRKGDDGCNGQKTCKWEEAKTHCNSLSLAGKTGWRLPDSWELLSIVNYGKISPAIDPTYFPDTASAEYWSSTTSSSKTIWKVNFNQGTTNGFKQGSATAESKNVRCVWGSQLPVTDLLDNKDGTVTDRSTGLIWQQKDDGTKRSWQKALAYCENLELPAQNSQKDWRLPNIKELSTIIDRSSNNPAINTTFFPLKNQQDQRWSSTVKELSQTGAWYVKFNLVLLRFTRGVLNTLFFVSGAGNELVIGVVRRQA